MLVLAPPRDHIAASEGAKLLVVDGRLLLGVEVVDEAEEGSLDVGYLLGGGLAVLGLQCCHGQDGDEAEAVLPIVDAKGGVDQLLLGALGSASVAFIEPCVVVDSRVVLAVDGVSHGLELVEGLEPVAGVALEEDLVEAVVLGNLLGEGPLEAPAEVKLVGVVVDLIVHAHR